MYNSKLSYSQLKNSLLWLGKCTVSNDTNWALDLNYQVSLSFRLTISTLRFSWKIKHFTEQNVFYRLDILHDFSISSL